MVSADEFGRSLRGAAALMGRRRDALAAFDTSLDGFVRSFAAIVWTLPAFVVSLGLARRAAGLDVAGAALFADLRMTVVVGTAHLATFLAVPVAMVFVARALSLGPRYAPFVVATNWISVFGSLVLAVPGALLLMDLETVPLTFLFTIAFGVIVLQAQWFAARITLGIGMVAAALLTASGLVLDIAVAEIVLAWAA